MKREHGGRCGILDNRAWSLTPICIGTTSMRRMTGGGWVCAHERQPVGSPSGWKVTRQEEGNTR